MAVVAAAAVFSLTLHVGLLAGLGQERGLPASAFVERGIPIVHGGQLGIRPREPFATRGWAKVRCVSDGRGHLTECLWLDESSVGWGDHAVDLLSQRETSRGEAGRTPGAVTFEMRMCTGLCPIVD